MRVRNLLAFVVALLFMSACEQKGGSKNKLIGKWHAVKLENAEMDAFFRQSQEFIDTMGRNNDDATNIGIYGVANMDSMRQVLQQQYDSAKAMQDAAVVNTVFTFRQDSMVFLSMNGNVDSSKWYMTAEGALVLQELNGQHLNSKMKIDVVSLSDTLLKLKFVDNETASTVTFVPEGK